MPGQHWYRSTRYGMGSTQGRYVQVIKACCWHGFFRWLADLYLSPYLCYIEHSHLAMCVFAGCCVGVGVVCVGSIRQSICCLFGVAKPGIAWQIFSTHLNMRILACTLDGSVWPCTRFSSAGLLFMVAAMLSCVCVVVLLVGVFCWCVCVGGIAIWKDLYMRFDYVSFVYSIVFPA